MAWSGSPSPWSSLLSSSSLSDLTVVIGEERHLLHRFPLFARSEFFRQKCEEQQTDYHVTMDLTWVPGGSDNFREIVKFCYGEIPNLTLNSVKDVILAAEKLGMSEEFSPQNVIQFCEDYLKKEIYASWKKSLLFLRNLESVENPETDCLSKVAENCIGVVLEYAGKVNETKENFSETIAEIFYLFEQLECLSPLVLERILRGFQEKNLTFISAGNFLAKEGYYWILSKDYPVSTKDVDMDAPPPPGAGAEIANSEFAETNRRSILQFLVEALELPEDGAKMETDPKFEISYLVTLLKFSQELASEVQSQKLRAFLNERVPKFSLDDFKHVEWETLKYFLAQYFDSVVELDKELPSDEALALGTLVDKYLLWAVHSREIFDLTDLQFLVKTIPSFLRVNCDVLYDSLDKFMEKNADVSESDRIALCEHLDPTKLSQPKVELAVENAKFPFQPSFFMRLYVLQKREIENQKREIESQKKVIAVLQTELDSQRELKRKIQSTQPESDAQKTLAIAAGPDSESKKKTKLTTFSNLTTLSTVETLRNELKRKDEGAKMDIVAKPKVLKMRPSTEFFSGGRIWSLAVTSDGILWVGGLNNLTCWRGSISISQISVDGNVISLSAIGGLLWGGGDNGSILLVDGVNGLVVKISSGEKQLSTVLAISKTSCLSGHKGKIKEWEFRGDSIVCTWTSPEAADVISLCKDSRDRIWSGGRDGNIKCWENRLCVMTLRRSSSCCCLTVSDFVFSGDLWGSILCWSLDGVFVKDLEGHKDTISGLVINKEGIVFSASEDGTIRQWKGPWKEAECVDVLKGRKKQEFCLAIDGENLWSGNKDGRVILWKPMLNPPL